MSSSELVEHSLLRFRFMLAFSTGADIGLPKMVADEHPLLYTMQSLGDHPSKLTAMNHDRPKELLKTYDR